MKYRKKPIVVEAFRMGIEDMPDWFKVKVRSKDIHLNWLTYVDGDIRDHIKATCDIKTLEGTMHGDYGDYIIKGINGEVYPCKPDIFDKSYEVAK